jgi:hypothetical protein
LSQVVVAGLLVAGALVVFWQALLLLPLELFTQLL